ncbi:MAG: GspE/PulE family protein [Acidobacteriota bacterium]
MQNFATIEPSLGASAAQHGLSLLEGLRAVPPRVARRQSVIPLRYEGRRLIAGARDPMNLRALDVLRRLTHDVALEEVSEDRYQDVMSRWYGPTGDVAELVASLAEPSRDEASLNEDLEAAPAPRFLDLTLRAALAEGASDVHFETDRRAPRVRFRIDGILSDRVPPPGWLADRVLGRIKALAGLALGESLYGQDGQLELETPQGPVAIRVSILPCDRGESAVLRLLTVEDAIPSLQELGMPETTRQALVRAAAAPDGLIVLAGPTGSGKTTTLHALLGTVDADRRNIVSIEDPVEIRSRRLRQVPVRRESGLDFAGVLRFVLRQDPDVILVGETRDRETAELVVQAALAGHLVLTTVHAASAAQIFDRFAQLGADRALLAQVMRVAVSQRLLRRLCPQCQGTGCFPCEGTGLKGRTGVFETLTVDGAVAAAVREGAGSGRVEQAARANGFRPMRESANDLVSFGTTTEQEAARVLETEYPIGSASG